MFETKLATFIVSLTLGFGTNVINNLLSLCFYTTMAFPKMRTFILAWFWCQNFFLEIKGLQGLAFSTTKPCTSFKCLVNNHLVEYATMQMTTLHFNFYPIFIHSLSFLAILGGEGDVDGWEAWSVSSSRFKPKIIKANKSLFCNKKTLTLKP
jgi:hypothetical protein